jgi:glycosyltransferase involved in cell wall biosynthesis
LELFKFKLPTSLMRILMLTQNIVGRGGTYARCFALARCLAALGHNVTLLAASRNRHLRPRVQTHLGVLVIEMGGLLPTRIRHGGLDPLDLLNRLPHILRNRYDLIHTFDHRPTVLFPALFHRALYRAPIVGDWCDLWGRDGMGAHRHGVERLLLTPADHLSENWLMAHVDAVTAISTTLKQRALALGHSEQSVRIIPAGASADLIRPIPVSEARQKFGLPLDAPILVFNGYTTFGIKLLGQAFVEVSRRRPDTLLLLVGGPLHEVEAIATEAGLQDSVRHFGEVSYDQLGPLLACGDVMLLPYPNESVDLARFPNKLGDYMAAGRPVVTNPVGDSGEMIRSEEIGLLADETPVAFAESICALLDDPNLRTAMGQRARQLAETRFSWRAHAEAINELYQALAEQGH